MNTQRVFILGAGFSAQAGMPLATDLTKGLMAGFDIPGEEDLRDWFKNLTDRIKWLNRSSGHEHALPSIEELFDLAPYDMLVHRMHTQATPASNSGLYAMHANDMGNALNQMEKSLWNLVLTKQREAGSKLKAINPFCETTACRRQHHHVQL